VAAGGCNKAAGGGAKGPQATVIDKPDPAHNLLRNATFDEGSLPWLTTLSAPAAGSTAVTDGAMCLTIDDKGKNSWDAQISHRQMEILQGHTYGVDFKIWASVPTTVRPKLGMAGPPYTEYWAKRFDIGTKPQRFVSGFSMGGQTDKTAEFAFHLGGSLTKEVPVTICIDDLYLTDPQFDAPPPEVAVPVPKVAVNQLGYLPNLAKFAVVESDAAEPVAWVLTDASGATVAEGMTRVFGPDRNSGHTVHQIDFSSYTKEGKGLVLKVGNDASHPFDIGKGIYSKLKYDALAYFYHNRSGIEITMPYAGDEKWTRPAGHLPDKAPCGNDLGCDYTLDVTRGWYDAGDHGKYVVNGGISAWTLLNEWERLKYLGKTVSDFGDGKMQIPENSNGVDDLLDEARWEVDFLMAMQAPDGTKFAGMVHHKMHDEGWTAIGIRPDQDTLKRSLRPVSTAATLNTAAVAAQAARIWKKRDPAYSKKCLGVAEKAYRAAKKFPDRYADPNDNNSGGGAYNDDYVKDEFYWAATELFITTGEAAYLSDMTANPHHKALHKTDGTFAVLTWDTTDSLGVMSLATVPSKSKSEQKRAQARLIKVADLYVANIGKEGYRTPLDAGGDAGAEPMYPWGSNSFVATNAMVMALAYDFTKKDVYRNGVVAAMDYILGVNALGQSYVTGYGEKPLRNPHHRFWAKQARSDFPEAPPGALSGGPNSSLHKRMPPTLAPSSSTSFGHLRRHG
jgi:endoglucanase